MEDWDFESNFKHSNFSIWSRIIKAETETFKLCLRHVLGAHAGRRNISLGPGEPVEGVGKKLFGYFFVYTPITWLNQEQKLTLISTMSGSKEAQSLRTNIN